MSGLNTKVNARVLQVQSLDPLRPARGLPVASSNFLDFFRTSQLSERWSEYLLTSTVLQLSSY
jgi:hypothetical protein